MRLRDLLIGIGVVASVCGAAAPAHRPVRIPAGSWRPLYGQPAKVAAFAIDRDAVTREAYLRWRAPREKASVPNGRAPMTDVTLAEAGAYCAARGGRLPTLAEWEYVGAASRTSRNASADPKFIQSLVSEYTSRAPRSVDSAAVNAYGVRGMHDLVWEWVVDANAELAAIHHAGMHHEHAAASGHDMSCAGAAMGAADPRDYPAFLRAAFRSGLTGDTRLPTLGFRCAY